MTDLERPGHRRILVIDDNHSIHGDFHKIFSTQDQRRTALDNEAAMLFGEDIAADESIPFTVDSAYQGKEGVEKVRQAKEGGDPYAMAIVDMRMPPGWDGVETTKKIWEIDPDVQVVICTAYSDYSWKDMLKTIGTGDRMIILKKPFEPIEAFQMANMLTEKWWLQQQARQKMEELSELVSERTCELQRSNQSLLRKNEEIQYFYHTLSHELKTPLTSALEFASIVRDGLAGELNETQVNYLDIVSTNCSHLAIYINDLLDSARLDTGKFSLNMQPLSLIKLIRQVMTSMQPAAAEKKIQLLEDLDTSVGDVVVDECRITQILTNLYNNALKFTPEGGSIIARLSRDVLRPGWVEVALADNGCGIPEDQIEHLFNRYFQVARNGPEQEKGVGLGLYLCHELVDLHGGEIHAESTLHEGSTFTFTLPMAAKAPDSAPLLDWQPETVDNSPPARITQVAAI